MNSILNNSAALSALQSLNMTQSALSTVQNEVSSGLSVANASDNATYWSIATQLNADSSIATSANTALAQSQAIFSTANTAIQSIITTINAIQSALTQATNPGPTTSFTTINTTLASLSSQLTDSIAGASFNGTNLLDGSNTSALSFVSGYNASSGAVTSIGFTASPLTGGTTAGTAVTTSLPAVSDATGVAAIGALVGLTYSGGALSGTAASNAIYNASSANNGATYGSNAIGYSSQTGEVGGTPGTPNADQIILTSVDKAGNVSTTTYTAVDANGLGTTVTSAKAFDVTQTVTPAASTSLLTQGGQDLTTLGSTLSINSSTAASTALANVTKALAAVTNYAASIGATQDRMTAASNFNSALSTDYSNGVAALVDADMNTASTRLQALQTQEQLGIQSLSIANQNAQLILKLFP